MDPRFRPLFNAQITPERYQRYVRELSERLGCTFEFRLAESPVFLPDDFKTAIVDAAKAIVAQLSDPSRLDALNDGTRRAWTRCRASRRSISQWCGRTEYSSRN
jgi:hypothetical protein